MKKILCIEDNENIYRTLKLCLSIRDICVIWAKNLDEAISYIENNLDDYCLITVDACLSSDQPNTKDLIKMILNKDYQRPIIANSSSLSFALDLKNCGATHVKMKNQLAEFILDYL